jgi:tetratricopeptide (TPR) repeat protein
MPTITEMSASGPGLATVSLRPSHDGFDDLPNHFWSSQIAHAREAVRAGHTDSRHALARTLVAAYKHGVYSDYNIEALHLFRSLQTSLSEDIDLTISLTLDFGEALFDEYRRTGEIEPVEELLRSRARTPSHEPLLRVSLLDCYFARGLLARRAFTGNQTDILDAKTIIDSLACHIEDAPHPNLLVALAEYHEVVWRTNSQYDLEQLHCLRCSLTEQLRRDGTTPNHPGILTSLFSVCTVLCLTSSYIDEYALRTARHALELDIKPLPDLFGTMSALASFYTTTARVSKEIIYMGQARECIDRMFVSAQDNKMDRGEAHYALGQWLFIKRNRFNMGDTSLLSDASTQIHKALSLCPTHHIYRYRYMVGATVCLLRQFECTGSVSALDDGIKLCQRSWEMVSTRALLAFNASSLLNWRARAGRLRLESRQALLRRSIEVLETALDRTPDSSTYRAELLYAMSAAYAQHGELGLVVDRATQICVARSAVSAHMDNPAQRSRALCRLAQVLATTAQEEQSTEALHESMSLIQDVTEESTDPVYRQCQEQASGLASLQAHCYLIRYKLQGDDADLATAQKLFELSFRDLTGRVTDQLTNSISWADKARYIAQPKLEMRAYRKAISILPQLAYIGGDVRTRVEALQLVEGLASRVAVVALTMHDAPGAVELLEQTRGVVWSQCLQLQAPSEVVPLPHAQDFARIAEALRFESKEEPEERRQWAEQLEAVIARIRQVEGYEDFMLPQVYAKLKACASHGAVVLVVPSGQFTDVIIITDPESAPVHLRLSALKRSRLHELTARLKRTSDYARDSAHEEYRKIKMVGVGARSAGSKLEEEYIAVLSELWLRLVYPVIVSLGIKVASDAPTAVIGLTILDSVHLKTLQQLDQGYGGARQVHLQSFPFTPRVSTKGPIRIASPTMWYHRIRPP